MITTTEEEQTHAAFRAVKHAIAALQVGGMVILQDDHAREDEGDLIMAAQFATPDAINFMSQYGRGLICMPIAAEAFERLHIPMMVSPDQNRSRQHTPFGVSIGAASGITTGISPADRAQTIRVAADPAARPTDIVMPGHIFPLKAHPQGVLARRGHTEGTVDLMRLAGLREAGVLCEIIRPDGAMARDDDLAVFAATHQLPRLSIAELVHYRLFHETMVVPIAQSALPLRERGPFTLHCFQDEITGLEHIALVKAPYLTESPLVRLHSQCLTGDVFASARCDCGAQLEAALERIGHQGGVLLYLNQEGRGIGLANKIKAYALQDQGLDTVEANHQLGFRADSRDYAVAAHMLRQLGIQSVSLMTNNPNKVNGLIRYGIHVRSRLPLMTAPTHENRAYLTTKREKLGHWLEAEEVV